MTLRTVLAAALVIGVASSAGAQEKNSLAVGGGMTLRGAADESAHGDNSVGLRWRFGHSDPGWGWVYGLGWYSTNLDREVGGLTVPIGELKLRPIVGGYGYTHKVSNRIAVSADLVGGFAFSSFEPTLEGQVAFSSTSAAPLDFSTSGLTPIVKPEAGIWYDLGHKFGLGLTVGYTIARPNLTISNGVTRQSFRLRADTFSTNIGVVYKIF